MIGPRSLLYDGAQVLYHTPGAEIPPNPEFGDLITVAPEGTSRTAQVLTTGTVHGDRYWPVPVSYFIALGVTFIGLALFFGRSVVKPLAATSAAAGDVAGGNLEITLPRSRVREVRELNAAFEGMAVELKESLEHEAKLEEERKQFISAIVHDLRTPLFALRGSFEAIETGVADTLEKQKYYFQLARERADALDRMITDLFEFTRLEYLDQQPVRAPLQLGELMERVAETVQPRAAAQDSTILLDIRPGLCEISADAHLLTRAIDNLLDNAHALFRTGQHHLDRMSRRARHGRLLDQRRRSRHPGRGPAQHLHPPLPGRILPQPQNRRRRSRSHHRPQHRHRPRRHPHRPQPHPARRNVHRVATVREMNTIAGIGRAEPIC